MQHVDALSKAPVEEAESLYVPAVIFNVSIHEDEILIYQRIDEKLARKIKILSKAVHERTRAEKDEVQDYLLRDGLLYKLDPVDRNRELYVIPATM